MATATASSEKHAAFLSSPRWHVLMITNHGIHQWRVIPGLPDTGGQNVFVNQFAEALTKFGFKITIVNRGGYPHPSDGEYQSGLCYKDEHQRILYLEDSRNEFVRKEDMHEQIPELVESLQEFFDNEGSIVDLIISHYWDAANIGVLYNNELPNRLKHIWVPHSLGMLKKENISEDNWAGLRIDERIEVEMSLIPSVDGVAATSLVIQRTLREDYRYNAPEIFLPPCVNPERYYPRDVDAEDGIWSFLSQRSGLSPEQIRECKIVTEISRTDTTKRKDVLIDAFARINKRIPNTFLVVAIDENRVALTQKLIALIREKEIENHTAVVGSIWDILPKLYAVTDIYCTPSVMEGFGMSAQEAAATKVPVVASNLVPYVTEYLLGSEVKKVWYEGGDKQTVLQGAGAIVVNADDVDGFAFALETLFTDEARRKAMGENAYSSTIPYFTWDKMVDRFLVSIDIKHSSKMEQ